MSNKHQDGDTITSTSTGRTYRINIEFDDIVHGRFVSDFNLNLEHFENWKSKNPWLYNMDEYLVGKFNKMFEEN